MPITDAQINTLERLARTQRNLDVPLTEQERTDLRDVARVLRTPEPRYEWAARAYATLQANCGLK